MKGAAIGSFTYNLAGKTGGIALGLFFACSWVTRSRARPRRSRSGRGELTAIHTSPGGNGRGSFVGSP